MSTPADMQLVLSLAAAPGAAGYRMHNAGYRALGLNYLYLPRRYAADVGSALGAVRTLGVRGVSLTMPFKVSCLAYLDGVSPEAEAIGAVNTVVNDGGVLTGYNTDAPAAQLLIQAHLPWAEKSWVILGAGGMARAFAHAARELQVQAYVCARERARASALAEQFGLRALAWHEKETLSDAIVFNATPVGMAAQSGALPTGDWRLDKLTGVFDAVAGPADTALVKEARARNLPVVSGDMLAFEQACLQFEHYTGVPAPRKAMREALYA